MNKQEVITKLAKSTGMVKADAEFVLDSLIDIIGTTLEGGEEVRINKLGVFRVYVRNSRQGINPKTKEVITLPEKKCPKFAFAFDMKKRIAGDGEVEEDG
jgi:DNA-binding protein HU-beta